MKRRKEKLNRFMAMSKLIGLVVMFISVSIIVYAMYEMHKINDLSALPTLIGGIFAILASYIGFYINMAKAEHIEDKKNQIKKELELIRRDGITAEERERELELESTLSELSFKLDSINEDENINSSM